MTARRGPADRRMKVGRFSLYIEPRDAWVGVYVAPKAAYVLLLPFVVLRWERRSQRDVLDFDPATVGAGGR